MYNNKDIVLPKFINNETMKPGSTRYKGVGINKIQQIRKERNLPPIEAHMAGGGLFGFK